MYAMRIDDFSERSLQYIFINNISREAKITTDKWKGYGPIAKAYDINQIESNNGANFKALHTMIHQIKSWIRTTYSWVSDFNINRYFNEFCFRINRLQSKQTMFNNLITKMVQSDKIYQTTELYRFFQGILYFNFGDGSATRHAMLGAWSFWPFFSAGFFSF